MKDNSYSIVILTFNSARYIQKCLESINLAAEDLKENMEVFVIDNGSKDETRQLLEQFNFNNYISFIKILFDANTGTTYSRNAALKKTNGDYVIILDSDAYINSTVLSELKAYLQNNDKCGLVVPKLIYPDGRYQLSVDQFPTLLHKIKRFLFLKKFEGKKEIDTICHVDYAISAFWMFPNRIINEVGLLDERIFYSPEDVDYCIRIWKKGYTIDYIPSVKIVHDAQEISRGKGFRINFFTLSHLKGLIYLFIKHRYFFSGRKFVKVNDYES